MKLLHTSAITMATAVITNIQQNMVISLVFRRNSVGEFALFMIIFSLIVLSLQVGGSCEVVYTSAITKATEVFTYFQQNI